MTFERKGLTHRLGAVSTSRISSGTSGKYTHGMTWTGVCSLREYSPFAIDDKFTDLG